MPQCLSRALFNPVIVGTSVSHRGMIVVQLLRGHHTGVVKHGNIGASMSDKDLRLCHNTHTYSALRFRVYLLTPTYVP